MEILNNYPIYEEKGSPEFIELVDSILNSEEPTYENRFAVIIMAADRLFPFCHMERDNGTCMVMGEAYLLGQDKLFNDPPEYPIVCSCQAKKLLDESTQNALLSDLPNHNVKTLFDILKTRVKWWRTVCIPAWEAARPSKEQ